MLAALDLAECLAAVLGFFNRFMDRLAILHYEPVNLTWGLDFGGDLPLQ